LVQAFPKKWWVESDFKVPNPPPLSLRLKVSGCHYNSIYNIARIFTVTQVNSCSLEASRGVSSLCFLEAIHRVTHMVQFATSFVGDIEKKKILRNSKNSCFRLKNNCILSKQVSKYIMIPAFLEVTLIKCG
jgi:hypothetical protein